MHPVYVLSLHQIGVLADADVAKLVENDEGISLHDEEWRCYC